MTEKVRAVLGQRIFAVSRGLYDPASSTRSWRKKIPPHSARVLSHWVDANTRDCGLAPKRVRDWISYMIIGGWSEEVSSAASAPRFTIKGAVALEMRLPEQARATKDIDLVIDGVVAANDTFG